MCMRRALAVALGCAALATAAPVRAQEAPADVWYWYREGEIPVGAVHVMLVAATTTTDVAATPPIVTAAPLWNAEPPTVIAVLVLVGPAPGVTEATTGGGT